MKFFICFTIFILSFSNAFAQGVEFSALGNSQASLDKVKARISELETVIADLNTRIEAVKACGDAGKMYNGTSCVDVVENDPLTQAHGKATIANCGTTTSQWDKAQIFNGTSWTCKLF